MRYHAVTDYRTGEITVIGRDGRSYTTEQVDDAKRLAAAGDPAARTILENIDLTTELEDGDPEAFLRLIHAHCPECQAAFEAGHPPLVISGREIEEMTRSRKQWFDARRWRKRKQRR